MDFPAKLVQPANANVTLVSPGQPVAGNEYLVACNARGDHAESNPQKDEARAASDFRHPAIAVPLYNRHRQVLLQLRKHILYTEIAQALDALLRPTKSSTVGKVVR